MKRISCIFAIILLIGMMPWASGTEKEINIIGTGDIPIDKKVNMDPSLWTYERGMDQSSIPYRFTIPSVIVDGQPGYYDLRDVDGENYVSSVKCQTEGTCWAHAIMAAIEGNLLITGNWDKAGETGEPNLAEYHLDWWNGFNEFNNDDDPDGEGLTVHWGAQCRMASAYFSRGEGAVFSELANDETEYDDNWFETPPDRFDDAYHVYYLNHIEIYDIGENLENIGLIKNKIMNHGPLNIVFRYDPEYMDENYVHYQPPDSTDPLNHNVVIIGWDDDKVTLAPSNGAWLCKNSWGSEWGLNGYFWISYYDKYCCHYDVDEWTATFQQVEPMPYKSVYYHDYHGWQDNFMLGNEAFNAFSSIRDEVLKAVSFYTCSNDVDFTVRVFDDFEDGELKGELSNISGTVDFMGFHTFELKQPVHLAEGDSFYIYLKLTDGGLPLDRTIHLNYSWSGEVTVKSTSHPGESYYFDDGWHDLYEFNDTANFCIKGLTSKVSDLECDKNINWINVKPGSTVMDTITISNIGESFSKLHWEISSYPEWGIWTFNPEDGNDLLPEHGTLNIQVSVSVPDEPNQGFSGEITIVNNEFPDDFEVIKVALSTSRKNIPFINTYNAILERFPMIRQILTSNG
jgi:C1A family cysteine protease